jgi:hypothetical protein
LSRDRRYVACAHLAPDCCARGHVEKEFAFTIARGLQVHNQNAFDHNRYRRLLAEAVDEKKRLALIYVLIEERARDRLELERASDQASMTSATIATVLRRASA